MSGREKDRPTDRLNPVPQWRLFRSLRGKLVFLLALAMLPAGALACLQALSNDRKLSALANESMLQAAVLSAREEENVIIAARRVLKTLSVIPAIADQTSDDCEKILAAVLSTSKFYGSAAIVENRGNIVCGYPASAQGVNVADQPWYRAVIDRGTFTVTGNARSMASNASILAASLPAFDAERNISRVLFLSIRPQWLSELLSETGSPGHAHIALVDRLGNVIAEDSGGADASAWLPDADFLRGKLTDRPQSIRIDARGAHDGILAAAPLLRDELYVVAGSFSGHPVAASPWRFAGAIGFPFIMWLIALAVAWFAVDRLVIGPILRLRRTAEAFAAGKKSIRASGLADMPDEIGQLGQTLNAMADKLAAHEEQLQGALEEQKTLLKELHHRVKNNLQIIASLLNLQIHRTTELRERLALRTTQHRIYALAKIHDSLNHVSGDNLVPLDEALTQIADHLVRGTDSSGASPRLHFDIEPVKATSKRAVPIALLLTEAMSTALSSSSLEDGPDNLWISLKQANANGAVLTVQSDSPPAKSAGHDSDALSAKLVSGFVKQLGAELSMETENGYRLSVTIPAMH